MAANEPRHRFLPFCSVFEDGRKTSRKKIKKEMTEGTFYPGEHHACVLLDCKRHEDGYTEECQVLYIGGTRRQEPTPNELILTKIDFMGDRDELFVKDINFMNMTGRQIPPLHAATAVRHASNVIVFGGYDLSNLSATDRMYSLSENRRGSYVVKQTLVPGGPSARFGHSFTLVGGRYGICFGGVTTDMRDSPYPVITRFRQISTDPFFYIFDFEAETWTKLPTPASHTSAFHSTTSIVVGETVTLFVIGGVSKTPTDYSRIPLQNVMKVTLDLVNPTDCVVEDLCLGYPDLYISGHSCVHLDKNLLVYGGITSSVPKLNSASKGSSTLYKISLESLTVTSESAERSQSDFITRGHSALLLDPTTILISGGTVKGLFLYTTRYMTPSPCDLADECTIAASDVVSPIPWIQCDTCRKWLHWHCAGIRREPRNFDCNDCKITKSEARKRTKKKR